jgi:broad specificity phosphatase PhoE
MLRVLQALLVVSIVLLPPGVRAQAADQSALMSDLRQGGYVIVFRHGATHRDQADTDPLNHDNVAKQRVLSDSGRKVAQEIGESWRKLGIRTGKTYTSRFHRAVETGKLISGGEVTPSLDITEGGLVVTPIENDRRAEALRMLVAMVPAAGTNTLIVSHKPNIIDAFGKDWFEIREGEASIFKPDGAGKAALVARLQTTDWMKAAAR